MKEVAIYSVIYLALFGFTEFLYYKFKVNVEHTRKIVHICTGLIALTFQVYLDEIWQVAILTMSFLGLIALSEKKKWFKSITAINRKSSGSWLFALVVLFCFWLSQKWTLEFYYLPILILSISDPMAALVGKKTRFYPIKVFGQLKTIGGTIAFFITTIALIFGFKMIVPFIFDGLTFSSYTWFFIISLALVSSFAELFSTKGWDNFTVPLSIIIVLLCYN